jgi:hypothetical protein
MRVKHGVVRIVVAHDLVHGQADGVFAIVAGESPHRGLADRRRDGEIAIGRPHDERDLLDERAQPVRMSLDCRHDVSST